MRASTAIAALALAALASPAAADTPAIPVTIGFQSYAPTAVEVLPGETVTWTNSSARAHTVTADDGTFDSGPLPGGGPTFSQRFASVGSYGYHCTIHAGMAGEIDVRRVILAPLPSTPFAAGQRISLSGRTADPAAPVAIQQGGAGGFHTIATATPAADGSWTTTIPATVTADYRAVSGSDISDTRRLLVVDRSVRLRRLRGGYAVTVSPPAPGATVLLELKLRERFGWWPVRRGRLDYLSRATFHVGRHAPARAVLVDRDGWTPLVASRILR